MQHFVDREQELQTLQAEYDRPGSALVVLYGRRRVGKTTLISEFIREKPALFFLASEESEAQNRAVFKEKTAEFLNNDLLRSAEVKSWDILFRTILDKPFDRKPVIVLDEFQYLGKSNPAFPSIFQRIWEEILKDRSVMVILCGSLISMMESQTLSYSSPLYGRRTAQIRLKQIPFAYYHEFFPEKSRRELIEWYAVTGGVPKYIELFSGSQDLYQAIQANILNRSGYLYDEPHFLLQQEVSEVGSYFSIIKSIAAGNQKLSAIAATLEVKSTSLTKYLRFWFAFVYPNMSFIESGHSALVLEKIRKSLVKNHIAFVYEDVCQERMWDLNAANAWPFHFSKLGRYWDAKHEIDLAALDPDGKNLILGECKYWQEPVGPRVFWDLVAKTDAVPWERDRRTVWYVLFSAAGFTDDLKALAAQRTDLFLFDEMT